MVAQGRAYSTLHPDDQSMVVTQAGSRDSLLRYLVDACGRRFLQATRLLDVENECVQQLRETLNTGYYVFDLYPAYDVIARRFYQEGNWAQIDAFLEDDCRAIWCTAFFIDWLTPKLILEDEFCRNVLRAKGMLPVSDKRKALDAIILRLEEITLPDNVPSWFG